ncbi:MAG: hypothetical protein EBY26_05990, partial [Microbacteriaceae bacterium]|nr:hypothetical protein [Microbacteriaceae bacterium]
IKGLGWVLDHKGWSWYFPYLIPFPIIGGLMMYSILHRKSLKKGAMVPKTCLRITGWIRLGPIGADWSF